jgi:predicted phage baseplate assembly protein
MALEAPRLDDRSYTDLVEEALRRIPLYCPEWTDHNASDPGITLIELFAWMTDIVLYRLNRVPDKHYIKFMELIGMQLREPEAARVPITFRLAAPQAIALSINAGTTVSTARTETEPAIAFTTDVDARIEVPELVYLMSSQMGQDQRRRFEEVNLQRLDANMVEAKLFTSDNAPAPDDALYLGFRNDLSHHLVGLDVEVNEIAGAGVKPRNPPFVWEVLASNTDQDWRPAEVDYDGTSAFNVNGLILLHLPRMEQAERNQRRAFWLRCRLKTKEEFTGSTYEVSPTLRKLTVSSWGITVEVSNVTSVENEVLGRSDGSPGQRFYLAHTPVVPRQPGEYLVVKQDDGTIEDWLEVSDFASSGPGDRHYTLDSISGEIRLAPAIPQQDGSIFRYGEAPPKHALLVMSRYRFGGGQVGNVASGAISVLKTSLPYIDRVENRQAASGGLDAEQLDDLKLRVPGHLRSLGRAVTAADYEHLALEAAPNRVSRAFCLQPSSGGEVKVLIVPKVPHYQDYIAPNSLRLPDEVRERVQAYLDERRLLTTRLQVVEPAYYWVKTKVSIHPAARTSPEVVRKAVEKRLWDFLNPVNGGDGSGWPLGRDLSASDIYAALHHVPGVDFIRSVELFAIEADQKPSAEPVDLIVVGRDGLIASAEHHVKIV